MEPCCHSELQGWSGLSCPKLLGSFVGYNYFKFTSISHLIQGHLWQPTNLKYSQIQDSTHRVNNCSLNGRDSAPDAQELHVICSQASFCLGGWNLLWGRVCLCFLGLPQEAVSQSDSSLSPAWTTWPSAPCRAHSRGPNYAFEPLSLPLSCGCAWFSHSDILSLALSGSVTFFKKLLSILIISILC